MTRPSTSSPGAAASALGVHGPASAEVPRLAARHETALWRFEAARGASDAEVERLAAGAERSLAALLAALDAGEPGDPESAARCLRLAAFYAAEAQDAEAGFADRRDLRLIAAVARWLETAAEQRGDER